MEESIGSSLKNSIKSYNYSISTTNTDIFSKLCSTNLYKNNNCCLICKEKFSFIKHKKNCTFCGEAVCRDHIKRKRENPEKTSKFCKICDLCNAEYLKKAITIEFQKRKQDLETINNELSEKYQKLLEDNTNKENIYNSMILNFEQKSKELVGKREEICLKIEKLKEDNIKSGMKKIDKEKQIEKVKSNILALLKEKELLIKNITKIEKEIDVINTKILAIELDIKQTDKEIQEIEKQISDANMLADSKKKKKIEKLYKIPEEFSTKMIEESVSSDGKVQVENFENLHDLMEKKQRNVIDEPLEDSNCKVCKVCIIM